MGGWQTKFSVSPGPGLWSLVLGPFGHDLGPGPELDNRTFMLEERENKDLTFQFNPQQKQEGYSRILAEALPLMEGKRKLL